MATGTFNKIKDAFEKATDITANSNLDNYLKPGFYGCSSSSTAGTLSNCPASTAFAMIVLASGTDTTDTDRGGKRQLIIGQNEMYFRGSTTTSWSAWRKVSYTQV